MMIFVFFLEFSDYFLYVWSCLKEIFCNAQVEFSRPIEKES